VLGQVPVDSAVDPVGGHALEQPELVQDATVAVERLSVRELPRSSDLDAGGGLQVRPRHIEEALRVCDLVEAPQELVALREQRLADRELSPARGLEELLVVVAELDER
jgi:hypothetical protein